ncbi:MAG TPA: pyridoxamine 5'-phosphate oxidase family protein [Acidimicrobiales bacterium]|nr:pyridoxamine 5'-phosphate oxidase family protein [Acidimicrobiales bacterium]
MSRRDVIKMTDAEVAAYLDGVHTLNTATLNHDGSIHLVAMWYAMLDGDCVFWTYNKSQKILNLQRDDRITGLVETGDAYEELRGVELVGRGEVVTEWDEIAQIGAAVVKRYFGPIDDEQMEPILLQTGAKRYGVRMKIDKVVSWDHSKLGGTY